VKTTISSWKDSFHYDEGKTHLRRRKLSKKERVFALRSFRGDVSLRPVFCLKQSSYDEGRTNLWRSLCNESFHELIQVFRRSLLRREETSPEDLYEFVERLVAQTFPQVCFALIVGLFHWKELFDRGERGLYCNVGTTKESVDDVNTRIWTLLLFPHYNKALAHPYRRVRSNEIALR